MRNFLFTVVLLFFTGFVFGQKVVDLTKLKGFEIHLLKKLCLNENSYSKMDQSERDELINQYNSTESIPDVYCRNYINIQLCEIEEKAFLTENDINFFDWDSKKISLSKSGVKKLSDVTYRYTGEPFVIMINSQPVLSGWFWYYAASVGCDRVFCVVEKESSILELSFGNCGANPLDDEEVLKAFLSVN
ncbi:hypothetical protein [Aureitalea marina]|uniref:Uncharacterized protein n=1 Tax=Aureitalea marina TaxID=930804 RepID=A0A2S7KT22_9FLAO|nr:hypothetical protein [Aureitalea marina]PQB05779.1 hypothetical protein BST85_13405 [Aureitalea marina]